MIRLLVAFILCASYLVKDGVLADWSWDESIHHAAVEHEHTSHDSHEDKHEHRNDDCCLVTHSFVPMVSATTLAPVTSPLITTYAPYSATYLPWTLAPPLRPPIV